MPLLGAVACWLPIRVSLLCLRGCLAGVGILGVSSRDQRNEVVPGISRYWYFGPSLRSDRQRQRLTRLSQEILSCRNAPERGLRMAPWLYSDGSEISREASLSS